MPSTKKGALSAKGTPHTHTPRSIPYHTTQPTTILRTTSAQTNSHKPPTHRPSNKTHLHLQQNPLDLLPPLLSHTYHNSPSPHSPKPSPPPRQKRPGARLAKRGGIQHTTTHTCLPPGPECGPQLPRQCARENVGPLLFSLLGFGSCFFSINTRQS